MSEKENELIKNLREEKNMLESHDRYPVRFLFFPLVKQTSQYIISLVSQLDLSAKQLSDFFPVDKWITWESLSEGIYKVLQCSSKDIVFFGLSEYLRLCKKEEVETAFLNLIGLENSRNNKLQKRRAYFIMDSFETILKNIIQENHHRNIFYSPIIFGNPELLICSREKPKLYITKIYNPNKNNLRSVKDYMDISAKTDFFDFSVPLYCTSRTICNLSNRNKDFLQDSLFEYELYDEPLTVLRMKIEGVNFESPFFQNELFVNWINEDFSPESLPIDFISYFKKKLEFTDLEPETILEKFFSINDDNFRSLIRLCIEYLSKKEYIYGFLNYIFSNKTFHSRKEFSESVYSCFDDIMVLNSYIDERKQIIEVLFKMNSPIDAPESIIGILNTELNKISRQFVQIPSSLNLSIMSNPRKQLHEFTKDDKLIKSIFSSFRIFALKFLTNYSNREKRLIVYLASNEIFEDNDLLNLYPELYGYLYYMPQEFVGNNSYLLDYFLEYKKSKLLESPTEKMDEFINSYTQKKMLEEYSLKENKNLDFSFSGERIYVLDGVGAEYLSLITYYLEKKHGLSVSSEIRKALLPTITSINKKLINSFEPKPIWIQDFDSEIIHGESYSVEKNIEKAITLIGKIVNRIVDETNGSPFVIIADHGCTASHKFFETSKKYDCFPNDQHDGRCCEIQEIFNPDNNQDDYIIYKDTCDKRWAIAIKPVSLNKTSRYEAHGGGTKEEIFVPLIRCSLCDSKVNYSINVIKKEVSGLDKTIKFTVSPMLDPSSIDIIEETGSKCNPTYSDGFYIASLSVGRAQKIQIKIGPSKFEVNVANCSGIISGKGGFF